MKEKGNNNKTRSRPVIFRDGSKTVKIASDLYAMIAEDAERQRQYPSQVIDTIVRNHYASTAAQK